jgi:signal transduction histidine kinase/PAS domain-containing protein
MDIISSPRIRLLVVVAAAIMVAELLIMFFLPSFVALSESKKNVLDAVLLTILVLPLLYFLLFRPMMIQAEARSKAYSQLTEVLDTLEQGKKEWEHTVDSLPELIFLFDEEGRALRANKTLERWNIALCKKIKGLSCHQILHSDCRDRSCDFSSLWDKAWDDAKDGNQVDFEIDDIVLGRVFFMSLIPLKKRVKDSDRNYIIVVCQDVTHSKKMEATIAQRQKALHAVYEMTLSSERTTKEILERVVQHISELLDAVRVLLTIKEGPMERTFSKARSSDIDKDQVTEIKGAPTEGVYANGEICQIMGDEIGTFGNTGIFAGHETGSYLGVPVKDSSDDVLGVISILEPDARTFNEEECNLIEIFARYIGNLLERDNVTRQLRTSQKMEVFGQLAAGVAHEVRNPLNAIMAITEALDMDLGDHPEYGKFLGHIKVQVDRLANLMSELLDLGKPIQKSNFNELPLSEICTATLETWKSTDLGKNHTVTLMEPEECSGIKIHCDSQRIQQVFLNILQNAAQHSPENSEIRLNILDPTDSYVRTQIIDAGTGIPDEHMKMVFEPFFTTRRKGTGMGLSIVRHIVETHGGSVNIFHRMPPPGCVVEVRLPIVKEGSI